MGSLLCQVAFLDDHSYILREEIILIPTVCRALNCLIMFQCRHFELQRFLLKTLLRLIKINEINKPNQKSFPRSMFPNPVSYSAQVLLKSTSNWNLCMITVHPYKGSDSRSQNTCIGSSSNITGARTLSKHRNIIIYKFQFSKGRRLFLPLRPSSVDSWHGGSSQCTENTSDKKI